MTRTGREYRRLSDDRGGNSIAEQAAENADSCAENGITLGESYEDPDRSASTFAKKRREDFDQLVSDLQTGQFGADVLVLWESSRGSREPFEWVSLLEDCKKADVRIWITTHERLYDLQVWNDHKFLLSEGISNADETQKTSKRTRRTATAQALSGRPHGKVPYGYKPVYDNRGELLTWVEDPDCSSVIKEVFKGLEIDPNMDRLTRDLKARGLWKEPRPYIKFKKPKPRMPFSRSEIRKFATNISYAGMRSHRHPITGKVAEVKGIWAAIIEPKQFYNVRRILANPNRRSRAAVGTRHVFTSIIRCNICVGPLSARYTEPGSKSKPSYVCAVGHVFIGRAAVDAVLTEAIIQYLSDPNVYSRLTSTHEDDERVAQVRLELLKARTEKDEMEKEAKSPDNSTHARILANGIVAKDERIEKLEQLELELTLPSELIAIWNASQTIRDWWENPSTTNIEKRAIAGIVLTPRLLGQVRIKKNRRGPRLDAIDRIRWVREEGEEK